MDSTLSLLIEGNTASAILLAGRQAVIRCRGKAKGRLQTVRCSPLVCYAEGSAPEQVRRSCRWQRGKQRAWSRTAFDPPTLSYLIGIMMKSSFHMESTGAAMGQEERIVMLGAGNTLVSETGEQLTPPAGWVFLPAGDAGLTRKVTAAGKFWRVQAQMGRRIISKGIWAPGTIVAEAQQNIESIRATDAYKKKMAGARRRRDDKQAAFEQEFYQAVRAYLAFAPRFEEMERTMAKAVTVHAAPVGSGTVARTTMIPVEMRAEKAVIAWMRHQTTAYDSMQIARIKGERREVRRMLAQRSVELLQSYRQGRESVRDCPLRQALELIPKTGDEMLPL